MAWSRLIFAGIVFLMVYQPGMTLPMTHVGVVDGRFTSELRRAVLRPNYAVGTPMFGDTTTRMPFTSLRSTTASVSAPAC